MSVWFGGIIANGLFLSISKLAVSRAAVKAEGREIFMENGAARGHSARCVRDGGPVRRVSLLAFVSTGASGSWRTSEIVGIVRIATCGLRRSHPAVYDLRLDP